MTPQPNPVVFPFVMPPDGDTSLPFVPLVLALGERAVTVPALVDTGSVVNVLPFSVGVQLGAVWEHQTRSFWLGGGLNPVEARGLLLLGSVGPFPPVRLVFGWARTDHPRVILGQTNFFDLFDACFYRSRAVFEMRPRPEA